jgi:hypothetical protein
VNVNGATMTICASPVAGAAHVGEGTATNMATAPKTQKRYMCFLSVMPQIYTIMGNLNLQDLVNHAQQHMRVSVPVISRDCLEGLGSLSHAHV